MRIFITGTDTNVGKTIVSSWLCLHQKASYFKPIQTGKARDSMVVQKLSGALIHPEVYHFSAPISPNLAASLEGQEISLEKINLSHGQNLVVEGAGGIFVPLNQTHMMIDLIEHLKLPVILVARTTLGTINHTLLSVFALKERKIEVLGIIFNGEKNQPVCDTIEHFSKVKVLAQLPQLEHITKKSLLTIDPPKNLTYG